MSTYDNIYSSLPFKKYKLKKTKKNLSAILDIIKQERCNNEQMVIKSTSTSQLCLSLV